MLPTTFGGYDFMKGETAKYKGDFQRPYERMVDSYQYDADTDQWTKLTHSVTKYDGQNFHLYRGRVDAAVFQIPRTFFPDC